MVGVVVADPDARPVIRAAAAPDFDRIREILVAAFPTAAEADLVQRLRDAQPRAWLLELVAVSGGRVDGHILFSPISVDPPTGVRIAGLAPMAVDPPLQSTGIGSRLVRAGLSACREQGLGAVVVLGHPNYYPRFGFRPASSFGLTSEYGVPDDVFLAQELEPGALAGVGGTVHYHAAFQGV